jgi:hypothetical protein
LAQAVQAFLARPGVRATLAVALVCNLVLAAAYVWSRDGQITNVRTEVRGDQFAVFIDGRLRIRAQVPAPVAGGVVLHAPNQRFKPPTLPSSGRIQSVRITSLTTSEVLYEAQELPKPTIDPATGLPVVVDLSSRRWRDYAVDVDYQNVLDADIEVVSDGKQSVRLRLIRYGLNSVGLTSTLTGADGQPVRAVATSEVNGRSTAEGATAAVLRSYPLAALLVIILTVSALVLSLVLPEEGIGLRLKMPRLIPLGLASACAMIVFGATIILLQHGLEGIPRVADEAAYLFQARILASGQTYTSTPPIPQAFSFSYTPFMVDYDGKWAAFYTFGHPLSLVPGTLVGAPWLMPPLFAAVNVMLMFGIARRMFDAWTGVLAAALCACSPFVLMQASSFMSHNTAIAFMLASIFAVVELPKRPYLAGALGGFFFGMFFNTRPLSAVAIVLPMAFLLLWGLRDREQRLSQAQLIGSFAVASLLMLVAYVGYNWNTTGQAFENGYQAGGDLEAAFGFAGAHSVANGIDNELANLLVLIVVLNGWPAWLGLMFVLMPFVLGTRSVYDWFSLAAGLFIFSAAAWFYTTGMVNGPRYVYEATPFLLLLTARGMSMLVNAPARIVGSARDATPTFTTELLTSVMVVGACSLVAASAMGWLLSSAVHSRVPAPASARDIIERRPVDGRLGEEADRLDLQNALVIVQPCDLVRYCYLSVFLRNNIHLDGNVVWAYQVGATHDALVRLYPCRSLYLATYEPLAITPGGQIAARDGESCE